MPGTRFVMIGVECPFLVMRHQKTVRVDHVLSLQFEESLISHKMAQMGDESEDETPDNEEDGGKNFLLSDDGKDIDLRYALACFLCITNMLVCRERRSAIHHAAVLA